MLAGLEWADLAVVILAAVTAGALDASVGSGGAVLLPALLAVTPAGVSAAVPLALNKAVAVAGNVVAAARYRRLYSGTVSRPRLLIALGGALLGVTAGVAIAVQLDVAQLTWLAAGALTVLVGYVLVSPHLGRRDAVAHPRLVPLATGMIGVYDGVIGPATGSLLQVALQRLLARPMHDCLGTARVIQAALNLTSAVLLWTVAPAQWWLVAVLALAHAAGGMLGAALTRRISAAVLRYALVICVAVSIVRLVI